MAGSGVMEFDRLDQRFDEISRKFVHRLDGQGYASVAQLAADVRATRLQLEQIDGNKAPRVSEYWLRLYNDFVTDLEDWPQKGEGVDELEAFNEPLVTRQALFTQTQATRIQSIAIRACAVALEPVATGILDVYGGSLTI